MLRKNKKLLILTSVITLLPILVGLLLWDRLPDTMATHWGADGQADGWSSRAVAVICPPLCLLAIQWVGIFITLKDPKNKDQHPKAFQLAVWIIPVLSVMLSAFLYFVALGSPLSGLTLMNVVLGLLFVVLGNYMPKFRQNHTMGIKIRWTLSNEENWNATHRFAGKVWMAGGLLILLCAFLPGEIPMIALLLLLIPMVAAPILFSWRLHKKQLAAGIAEEAAHALPRRASLIVTALVAVLVVLLAALLFTGEIRTSFSETGFTVDASFSRDLTLEYADIDSLELREEGVEGMRIYGFASARLLMGSFHSEELGDYTRFTYTGCPSALIIRCGSDTLVLSGRDEADTRRIYEKLLEKTAQGNIS